MFNTTVKGLMDIRAYCQSIEKMDNLEHPRNSNIKLVNSAKWILSKTKIYPAWIKAFNACSSEPIQIPLSEGILINLDNIEEILEHHNVKSI